MRREASTLMKLLALSIVAVLFIHACSVGPDPTPPFQTRIIEVRVEPNPITTGDTATFTCVIEDSLDERFSFEWGFQGVIGDTTTNENFIHWKAPDTSGTFLHTVDVFNGSKDSLPTGKSFNITVVDD